MDKFDRKAHWENVYQTKELKDVGWFQPIPKTSLAFLDELKVPLTSKIIDIGGGDSLLVDNLLKLGYLNITVLDVSERAIERAKDRLGDQSKKVKWIIADASKFNPDETYDFWHDRAAFHFLTDENEISNYLETAQKCIRQDGMLLIGTFSVKGPKTCSGIEVKQYSESRMTKLFEQYFEKIKCITTDHKTPSGSLQNYIFCCFRKLPTRQ